MIKSLKSRRPCLEEKSQLKNLENSILEMFSEYDTYGDSSTLVGELEAYISA